MAAHPSASMKEAKHLPMRTRFEEGDFSSQEQQVCQKRDFNISCGWKNLMFERRNTNVEG